MHHRLITLALADAILADLEIHETRREEHFSATEGLHPALGLVVVIKTRTDAVLISEQDLDTPRPKSTA